MLHNKRIKCPKCNSTSYRKNGYRRGKQCYQCRSCGRQFVESPIRKTYPSEVKQRERITTRTCHRLLLYEVRLNNSNKKSRKDGRASRR